MGHPNQLASSVAFLHLAIDQASRHLPLAHDPPATTFCDPVAKMSRQGIEVEVEPVTGEKRKAIRGQSLSQRVDEPMGHVLGAGTQLEHRQNLRARIESQPQPEHLTGAAQPGTNFIQLQVREMQMAEEALMQGLRVRARASATS